jgi:hypothetical protein
LSAAETIVAVLILGALGLGAVLVTARESLLFRNEAGATPGAVLSQAPTPGNFETELCAAITDLKSAHDEHAAPVAQMMLDLTGGLDPMSDAQRGEMKAHLEAIALVFLSHAQRLEALRSPEHAELIVAAKEAYGGYGEGITQLRQYAESGSGLSDTLVAGLQRVNDGRRSLDEATEELRLLHASGSVDCPI